MTMMSMYYYGVALLFLSSNKNNSRWFSMEVRLRNSAMISRGGGEKFLISLCHSQCHSVCEGKKSLWSVSWQFKRDAIQHHFTNDKYKKCDTISEFVCQCAIQWWNLEWSCELEGVVDRRTQIWVKLSFMAMLELTLGNSSNDGLSCGCWLKEGSVWRCATRGNYNVKDVVERWHWVEKFESVNGFHLEGWILRWHAEVENFEDE